MYSIKQFLKDSNQQTERRKLSASRHVLHEIWQEKGVFEGQSIEWKGNAYSGKAGALYFWIEQLCLEGVSVVWIDEEGALEPDAFGSITCQRFWMVRPSSVEESLYCVETILRSGVFEVIVIDGHTLAPEAKRRRLRRLAKIKKVILVWIHQSPQQEMMSPAHRVCIHSVRSSQNQGVCSEWGMVGRQISLSNQRRVSQRKNAHLLHLRGLHPRTEEEYEYSDRRSKSGLVLSLETESCQI